MNRRKAVHVVVDASVARAAGESDRGRSKACREVLDQISANAVRSVFCKALMIEWRKHSGNYATKWLKTMVSRKNFVIVSGTEHTEIAGRLQDCQFSESNLRAAKKDFHLIDSAMSTGRLLCLLTMSRVNCLGSLHRVLPTSERFHG
jgi:hypothetical protein